MFNFIFFNIYSIKHIFFKDSVILSIMPNIYSESSIFVY